VDTGTNDQTDSDTRASDSATVVDTGTIAQTDTGSEVDYDPFNSCTGFVGTDMLVVMDNSVSMAEEQEMLGTAIYSLVNTFHSLTQLVEGKSLQELDEVRIAVVSSDIGLQYGVAGEDSNEVLGGCTARGDDGQFQMKRPPDILLRSGEISCNPDLGIPCPDTDWHCGDAGLCNAPGGAPVDAVPCANTVTGNYADYPDDDPSQLASHLSCMAKLGTEGCNLEQQLQAGLRALSRPDQKAFLKEDHRLAIVVVSDEEDCSIEDSALFRTDEWIDFEKKSTACHMPLENEESYLFNPEHYRDAFIALKNGREHAVAFLAFVGVPVDSTCEGFGDDIVGCLDDPLMAYEIEEMPPPAAQKLRPVCEREVDGELITQAQPGRRYVELAQAFGKAGFVYSICNEDWSEPMMWLSTLLGLCYMES
jgi:hypothetical protein